MKQDPDDHPIRGLASLEKEVTPSFLHVWRRKTQRRNAAAHFAGFSWTVPQMILLELISLIVHLFSVADGRKGRVK